MLASELDFYLPPQLIAQEPARPRDTARLMRLDRRQSTLSADYALDYNVRDLPQLLRPDDLLVFNDSRVLRARLHGRKVSTGAQTTNGARVEAILLREIDLNLWQVLLKPSARLKPGTPLLFSSPDNTVCISAQPIERNQIGWLLRFEPEIETSNEGAQVVDVRDLLARLGEVPLPPYIRAATETQNDGVCEQDYQTVFARDAKRRQSTLPHDATQSALCVDSPALDSAAAPTAGLHFTPELLGKLRARGVQTAFVTLGIGIGTFRPIQAETLEEHVMHREEWEIPVRTAQLISEQKKRGARVVAVGTTTTRVLESAADESGIVAAGSGATEIFMRPGYRFRCIDALLTNFHLPRSSLIALVAAWLESPATPDVTGLEKVRYAYGQAIARQYRFYSFGDAMLIE